MKFLFLFLLNTVLIIPAFSQNAFEPGYVIDHDGSRQECLIRNPDWGKSPNVIRYKRNENAEVITAGPAELAEFGVGQFRFITSRVRIDQSSDDIRTLSDTRRPDFREQMVFLKVLVDGEASLYLYDDDARRRFYYSANGKVTEPLIYKRYNVDETHISENNRFHQQLYTDVNCDITAESVQKVNYDQVSLVRYFTAFSNCRGVVPVAYKRKSNRRGFKLTPKIGAGVVYGDILLINRQSSNYTTEISGAPHYAAGLDLEFLLPLERDRFSILVTPGYEQFSFEEIQGDDSLSFNSKFITVGVGMRYSVYQNETARWFGSFQYVQYIPMGADYTFYNGEYLRDPDDGYFEMNGSPGVHMAFGRVFTNKLMVQAKMEFRFETGDDYIVSNPVYSSFFLELGYSIF